MVYHATVVQPVAIDVSFVDRACHVSGTALKVMEPPRTQRKAALLIASDPVGFHPTHLQDIQRKRVAPHDEARQHTLQSRITTTSISTYCTASHRTAPHGTEPDRTEPHRTAVHIQNSPSTPVLTLCPILEMSYCYRLCDHTTRWRDHAESLMIRPKPI